MKVAKCSSPPQPLTKSHHKMTDSIPHWRELFLLYSSGPLSAKNEAKIIELVNTVSESEINLKSKDSHGGTLLMSLCGLGHVLDLSNLFFSSMNLNQDKIDLNLQCAKWGNTALHYAAGLGNVNALEHLLRLGADIKVENLKGDTVLHVAAAGVSRNREVIRILVAQSSEDGYLNHTNKEGMTPRMVAAGFYRLARVANDEALIAFYEDTLRSITKAVVEAKIKERE